MRKILARVFVVTAAVLLCAVLMACAVAEAADAAGLEMTVGIKAISTGQYCLFGRTAGVRLEIRVNDSALKVRLLSSGLFFSEGFEISGDISLVVRAWDAEGHVNEQWFGTEPKPDSEIGEVWPEDEGGHDSNKTLALAGWYAVQDEDTQVELALYHVGWIVEEQDGKSVEREVLEQVGEPIDLSDKKEMSDAALALHASLWPKEAEVSRGYSFSIEVPLLDFGIVETGQYRLILRLRDPIKNVYYEIGRCDPPFMVWAWPDWRSWWD